MAASSKLKSKMKQPLITLTTDFGIQSQGIGIMECVIARIAPTARVIHFMHGLPSFDLRSAARTVETLTQIPVGYHVCVVDPGVGTKRKALIIQTKRGDYLIGPDNGVLIPACDSLGGFKKVVEVTNPLYMEQPVSPIFHGRDIFAPAAAYLATGIPIESFGPAVQFKTLFPAPYQEATLHKKNDTLNAQVIHINKFGSLHLNILHSTWAQWDVKEKQKISLTIQKKKINLFFVKTFGEVAPRTPVILKDDYGRVEIALTMDDFAKKYGVKIGEKVLLEKR